MSTLVEIAFIGLLGYFLMLNALYLAITIAALVQLDRQRSYRFIDFDRMSRSAATLPVSVLIPAYNEAEILGDALVALLASNYREFEVIVVNDGSTDDMLERAIRDFELEAHDVFYPTPLQTARVRATYRSRLHPNLWVIDKENGGGADSVNAALNLARYPFVVHIDADCLVEPETLIRLMRPMNFATDEIVVVGATLRVANGLEVRKGRIIRESLPSRLVERFQVIEYLSSFVLNRLGWAALNAIPVISGACGVWPKRVLMDLGGLSTKDTHCDIEATIHAHAMLRSTGARYRIINVPEATVWTQVPMSWRDLQVQRKRWQRVVFEMLWKYRTLILNPRYGYFGMLGMPYLLLYEGVGAFIETFAYVFVVALGLAGALSVKALLLFLFFSFGLTAIVRLLSLLADILYFRVYSRGNLISLAGLALLEAPIYHVAQLPYRMFAFVEFLRGQRTHEMMPRTAIAADRAVPSVGGEAGDAYPRVLSDPR
jgi:cellulose synthase/poly-beta-1,6-N-acetylglucosamine synthase-like glycosyltransferase